MFPLDGLSDGANVEAPFSGTALCFVADSAHANSGGIDASRKERYKIVTKGPSPGWDGFPLGLVPVGRPPLEGHDFGLGGGVPTLSTWERTDSEAKENHHHHHHRRRRVSPLGHPVEDKEVGGTGKYETDILVEGEACSRPQPLVMRISSVTTRGDLYVFLPGLGGGTA